MSELDRMANIEHSRDLLTPIWTALNRPVTPGDRFVTLTLTRRELQQARTALDNLAGAVEALREVERVRHLEGKDAGTKADIMARIARDALHQFGGQ